MTSKSRTPLSQLLAQMQPTARGYSAHVASDWMQGRAIYGGLSTALCLAATLRQHEDLPPLRSANIAFIGPAGADVEMATTLLRRGKSTAFIRADLGATEQTAVSASLCFGTARESSLQRHELPAPAVPAPADCPDFFRHEAAPDFAAHFDAGFVPGAMPLSGAEQADICAWVRHRDRAVDGTMVGLVALADALPPAVFTMLKQPAPASTMTWHFDILADAPRTEEGWWLCRSTAESVDRGYASQCMTVWNSSGEAVIVGRQNVAVFA